jgi:hypothetical protein
MMICQCSLIFGITRPLFYLKVFIKANENSY